MKVQTLFATVILLFLCVSSGYSQKKSSEKPVTKTKLLQMDLADIKGKEVIINRVEIAPGESGPKHYHPDHLFGYVLEGAGTKEYDGEKPIPFSEGEAFYEIPNRTIIIRNTSTRKPVVIISFLVKDKNEPGSVKVK